jgi:hypothetical protein
MYMNIFTYIYMFIHIDEHTYINICFYIYIYIVTCIDAYVYTYVYMFIDMNIIILPRFEWILCYNSALSCYHLAKYSAAIKVRGDRGRNIFSVISSHLYLCICVHILTYFYVISHIFVNTRR